MAEVIEETELDQLEMPIAEHKIAAEAPRPMIGFMSLSAELRNEIYELVVTPQEAWEGGCDRWTLGQEECGVQRCICVANEVQTALFSYGADGHLIETVVGKPSSWRQQPAITRVSRQVRKEALPMYYGLNTFVAYTKSSRPDVTFQHLKSWLGCIGQDNRVSIKNLRIYNIEPKIRPDLTLTDIKAFLRKYGLSRAMIRMFDLRSNYWYEGGDGFNIDTKNLGGTIGSGKC